MTATTINSRLNPFADAFIPSSLSNFYMVEKLLLPTKFVNKKEILPICNVNEESTNGKTPKIDFNVIKTSVQLSLSNLSSWNEDDKVATRVDVTQFCASDVTVGQSVSRSEFSVSQISHSSIDHEVINKGEDFEGFLECEKEPECLCPPMFGWVIPLNFSGNPFNTKYCCNKKYAHITWSPKDDEIDIINDELSLDDAKIDAINEELSLDDAKIDAINEELSLDDAELKALTLDQCSRQYIAILLDLCDSISKCEKNEIEDNLETSDYKSDDKRKRPSWSYSTSEFQNPDSHLVDDGCHPLLQEAVAANANEDEKEIESIEKILQASLMPPTDRPSDCAAINTDTICNPPCSVWCDFLPSAAKDTFKKYVKKYGLTTEAKVAGRGKASVVSKPLFKRSFSADDTLSCAQHSRCFQTSTAESKETLLLIKKDPVAYFRRDACNALKDGAKQYRSCSDLDCQSHAKSDVDSPNMWGPFDGADSLWKPLPDCVPTNESMKQSCYKKGREMRRQRSLN